VVKLGLRHPRKKKRKKAHSEKMRLEMVIGMEIEILNDQDSGVFSNQHFEKRLVISIEDFDFDFVDYFGSHLFGNGLLKRRSDRYTYSN